MKKIMIAAVAMAMAVAANAASVNWQVSASLTQVGYTAYVMAGDVVSTWESLADVQTAAVDSGAIAKISARAAGASGTATDDALTKSGNFYYVIVNADATQYAVSGAFAGADYVYDMTATPPESAPATAPTFAANDATFSDWDKADEPIIPPPSEDVPEPTSGLLLLVGAAALALKRKVA
jgi:hypothetical protein